MLDEISGKSYTWIKPFTLVEKCRRFYPLVVTPLKRGESKKYL